MSFTNTLETLILDGIFTDPAYAPNASQYVALSTSTPTEAGGNFTEPNVAYAYNRVLVNAAAMAAAAPVTGASTKANGSALTFPQASGGSWGTVTYFGIFDVVTPATGVLQLFGLLSASKTIDDGDQASFAIGAMVITLD